MLRTFHRLLPLGSVLLAGMLIGYSVSESLRQVGAQALAAGTEGSGKPKVMRVGAVIGLKPEMKEKYIRLHADPWPGVLAQIRRSNIRDYSIFLAELEGKLYLFASYDYVGDDFEADMKAMAADETTQRWWKETAPSQGRLPGTPEGEWWKRIPEVFHTD